MTVILYIAAGYLILTSLILLLNSRDFQKLPSVPSGYFERQAPKVSICIPARNEAESVERCVRSALKQRYPDIQVLVLDDGSTDGTTAILDTLQQQFPQKLCVISGRPTPEDWLGKPWACHQLAQAAGGDILLFIDADTWLHRSAVAKTVRRMGQDILDFITVWPSQKLGTFWEKAIIPLIYMTIFTLLPVRYVRNVPQWIPSFIESSIAPLFSAACGQFMAFKRKSYEAIGGHTSVKDHIVEDVGLARNIKKKGMNMNMYHGEGVVHCRMYRSHTALWQGLRKNFFAGFGFRLLPFILTGFLQFTAYIFPVLALPFLLTANNLLLFAGYSAAILLMLIQRAFISRWFHWNAFYALLHPLGVGWFQILGIRALLDYFTEQAVFWKGREL